MAEQFVLFVHRLMRPLGNSPPVTPADQEDQVVVVPIEGGGKSETEAFAASSSAGMKGRVEEEAGEDEPLIQGAECRICQDEDRISNMEVPCSCSGSLKYAHRKCVQRWCNEKGDITCEICHQPYRPGYTAPPPSPQFEETAIDMDGGWTISGTHLDLHNSRLLSIAEAERQFLDAQYDDDYAATSASGAAFCRSAALILMALLLLRHAFPVPDSDDDDDPSAFLSLFLLRAAGFLLPCYIMAHAVNILQRKGRDRLVPLRSLLAMTATTFSPSGPDQAPTPKLLILGMFNIGQSSCARVCVCIRLRLLFLCVPDG